MDWRELKTRLAWGGAFLVAGCMLPYAAQRWLWSPVQVTVVNGLPGEALQDVELVLDGQAHAIGTLGAAASHQLRLGAVGGSRSILVRYSARGQRREAQRLVPVSGDSLRLALAPGGMGEVFVLDTP